MKYFAIAVVGLFSLVAVPAAQAADLPNPVSSLVGPGIGYLLAQSDLCGWGMSAQIKTAYQNTFSAMGLSATQQASIWQAAAMKQTALSHMPAMAKAGMKRDTCGPAFHAKVEAEISN